MHCGGELVQPKAEALVELVVVRRAELDDRFAVDLRGVQVDRVQLLVEQPEPGALEPFAPVAIRLVRHHHAQHPVRDLLAVDGRLELGLDLRELLLVRSRVRLPR